MPDKDEIRRYTLAELDAQIERVRQLVLQNDFEAAHEREDEIYRDVLEMIAHPTGRRSGGPAPKVLALKVLELKNIVYPRYCA